MAAALVKALANWLACLAMASIFMNRICRKAQVVSQSKPKLIPGTHAFKDRCGTFEDKGKPASGSGFTYTSSKLKVLHY
jgi:hypothetical protein